MSIHSVCISTFNIYVCIHAYNNLTTTYFCLQSSPSIHVNLFRLFIIIKIIMNLPLHFHFLTQDSRRHSIAYMLYECIIIISWRHMPCGDVDDVDDDNSVEDMDEFKWKYVYIYIVIEREKEEETRATTTTTATIWNNCMERGYFVVIRGMGWRWARKKKIFRLHQINSVRLFPLVILQILKIITHRLSSHARFYGVLIYIHYWVIIFYTWYSLYLL